jgi:hypothetical protein
VTFKKFVGRKRSRVQKRVIKPDSVALTGSRRRLAAEQFTGGWNFIQAAAIANSQCVENNLPENANTYGLI